MNSRLRGAYLKGLRVRLVLGPPFSRCWRSSLPHAPIPRPTARWCHGRIRMPWNAWTKLCAGCARHEGTAARTIVRRLVPPMKDIARPNGASTTSESSTGRTARTRRGRFSASPRRSSGGQAPTHAAWVPSTLCTVRTGRAILIPRGARERRRSRRVLLQLPRARVKLPHS